MSQDTAADVVRDINKRVADIDARPPGFIEKPELYCFEWRILMTERDLFTKLLTQARDYFRRVPPLGGNDEWTKETDGVLRGSTTSSRPDAEAIAVVPQLAGKQAVVLYFETDQDRREFVALIREAKPGLRAVNI